MDAVMMHEARDTGVAGQVQPEAGADEVAAGPLRRCIVTRAVRPRHELLRLVIAPDGTAVPDIEGRLPGRGLWITPSRPAIAEAMRRGTVAKAAKRQVTVPPDLADRIEAGLTRRCLDLLGLARRAGQAVSGFEKVRARLREGKVAVLVEAADGAADGRRKIAELAAAAAGAAAAAPTVAVLTAAELAAALGRETAVHVALSPGRLADRFREAAARLERMRAASASVSVDGDGVGGKKKIGTRND